MFHSIVRIGTIVVVLSSLATAMYFMGLELTKKQYHSYSVVRTENGFVPRTIVVPKGSTVTFTSTADTLFWPASDLHPTHTIYSEFDPKRALEPEESWSFKFTQPGKWALHDHLASHFTGLIEVRDTVEDNQQLVCSTAECWGRSIFGELEKNGIQAAYAVLTNIYEENEDFARQCHYFAHDIGLKAYILKKRDVTIPPETTICNAGFYHGYLEGLLNDVYDPEYADTFCTEVGLQLKDAYPNAENQCRHGIGHGVHEYMQRNYPYLWDEPDILLEKSLAICDQINESYDQKMRCASGVIGVFGEWSWGNSEFTTYTEPENILGFCSALDKEFAKHGCYWELSRYLSRGTKNIADAAAAGKLLLQILPEHDREKYTEIVVRSFAIHFGKSGVFKNNDALVAICRTFEPKLHTPCISGITEGLMFAGNPKNLSIRVLNFCQSELLSNNEKGACYLYAQEYIADARPGDLANFCASVPTSFMQDVCNI